MAIKWPSVSSFHLKFDDVKSRDVVIDCIVMNVLVMYLSKHFFGNVS